MTETPEQRARQQIDAQLAACGWAVQNSDTADFSVGRGIALREVRLKTGPCDYLLLVDRKAVGVIEAKKEGTTLSGVAEQSARYAANVPVFLAAGIDGPLPFLYESTGVETLFRDQRDPEPRSRRVFAFHRPETLAEWAAEFDTLRARLRAMPAAHPLATNGMRDCQIEAVTGLEKSFVEDRPRALKRSDLDDFVACYYRKNRNERKESERFKSFSYDELIKRDKLNLDILKDEALEESANLPAPEVIAADIAADLEAALEQFATIAEDLK